MTTWHHVTDLAGAALLLVGALVCLSGVIGLLRLPDVLTRSSAATNPQTLGILLLTAGVALRLRSWVDLGTLALVVFFQLLTSPVAAHLVARVAYRTGQTGDAALLFDELADSDALRTNRDTGS
ncbi:monovalent cation/H(+) antiporter subunit G [Streptomyces longispororuber]|uniref:monovalent cation/H(+) antiporter subunit G n=1 Tax=Streptomyces longispororuber TaxID=68230 RepID=UPI00210D38C6|nr:monovalent cation/H(+) antiporter subunit G [Streptomyces longispororuber]MCQ4212016.1 monovalent cation/H(+) antiporter subunit G [Streptomyces longispororuber]